MTGTLMAFVEGILRATASQSAEPALAEVFQTVRSQKDAWTQLVQALNEGMSYPGPQPAPAPGKFAGSIRFRH